MKPLYNSLNEDNRGRYAAVETTKLANGGVEYSSSVLHAIHDHPPRTGGIGKDSRTGHESSGNREVIYAPFLVAMLMRPDAGMNGRPASGCCTFQIRTPPSLPPEARRRPSAEKANEMTAAERPLQTVVAPAPAMSQSTIFPRIVPHASSARG